MSGMDFEYAIKKDVRNNLIVREVDDERQRQVWRSLLIGGVLVTVILFSAWQHFELLQHGYRIQRMQQQRAVQVEINRHLRLEIATLRSPVRIEDIATRQLHLVAPTRAQAIVIQRVTPSAPPGKSIVAAR
ncbi:MAG: cell division protein FtsL [Acidobacteriota bacterium]